MRLKQLSLQGYKTFASKTSFEFNESITAVVGPNGSGKSNIADAIRWVLGEQSYSTLRGKRTEDMIFAGSRERARAGMAQAVLTLDNSEGWLPIDYSEIEIGRRAFRSGENEYLLNGQKVRLRDVTELLANSGLAQRTYTIIGQGLVDQALSLKADQRRMLFEEAAGVSGYRIKRSETLRRLDETTRNLERLHDIVSEIRPRLNSLQRQANRARNYEQVAADLRHHLRIWHGYNWDGAKRNLQQRSQACELARKEWEDGHRQLANLQEKLLGYKRQISQQQAKIRKHREYRDELRDKLEHSRRAVAVLDERKSAIVQQLDELEEEIPRLQNQQSNAQQEMDHSIEDLRRAESELEEKQAKWQASLKSVQNTQSEIDQRQKELHELSLAYERVQNDLAISQGTLSQLRRQVEEKQAALKKDMNIADLVTESENYQANLQATTSSLEDLRERREKNLEDREQQAKILEQLQKEIDQLNKSTSSIRDEIAAEKARMDLLDRMRMEDIDSPDGVAQFGQFVDLVTIPIQYRAAIEAALRHKLTTQILPDEAAMWRLTSEKTGRQIAAIVAGRTKLENNRQIPDHPGVVDWADVLVDAAEGAEELVQILLGRILIVRDAETAYSLASMLEAGTIAVSIEGFVAHADGLVEYGSDNMQIGILAREEERQQTAANLVLLQERLEPMLGSIRSLQEEEIDTMEKIDQFDGIDANFRQRTRSIEHDLSEIQQAFALFHQRQSLALEKVETDKEEVKQLGEQILELEHSIETRKLKVEEQRISLQKAREQLDNFPIKATQEQKEQLQQQLDSARTILAGRQAVIDSRRATLSQADSLLQRRLERQKELKSLLVQIEVNQSQADLKKLEASMDATIVEIRPLEEELEKTRQEIETLELDLGTRQRQSHDLETHYTQSRIELGQSENAIEILRDKITADLGFVALTLDDEHPEQSPLPIADMVEKLPEIDDLPEDIEGTIQRLRGQLNRMGGFNPDAPVEYEETRERHDFLVKQIEDLETTRRRLRQVIEELDEETSRAFAATVEQVDAVFGDVFKRLFGGGSAQLVLTDPDDLITSGVDIVARLPRRREQGLALLSGGERSLTAAALIFALLKVSPTPFCVLDEVDAMLDEANVNRFRDMLMELSQNTQFILITHNRGTVQVAESVYGVSMGADSASQVISIRPEEYVNSPVAD